MYNTKLTMSPISREPSVTISRCQAICQTVPLIALLAVVPFESSVLAQPTVVAASPSGGSGMSRVFSVSVLDTSGISALDAVQVIVNSGVNLNVSIRVSYTTIPT